MSLSGSRDAGGRSRLALLLLFALTLSACGSGGDGGTPTLRFYVFKEPGGAFAEAAARCSEAAAGRYRIEMADLPPSADQQREQLVRRLAARDSDIDIMGMDVIWTAEFAGAGWLLPWRRGAGGGRPPRHDPFDRPDGHLRGPLWAAPYTTNTQLLWYRNDRVPRPPATWDEMLEMAEQIGPSGAGSRSRATATRASPCGSSRSWRRPAGRSSRAATGWRSPPAPTTQALEVMKNVAASPVADPGLSTAQEDDARLAFESGGSAFMVNYTFVWPSAQENAPEVARHHGLGPLAPVSTPRSRATSRSVASTSAIGAYSDHPDLAFEAATCLRSAENQVDRRPAGRSAADHARRSTTTPAVREAFPFADTLRETLLDATERPATPAYNDMSLAIQRTLHPTPDIQPAKDAKGCAPASRPRSSQEDCCDRPPPRRWRRADEPAPSRRTGVARSASAGSAGCCAHPAVVVMLAVTAYPMVYAVVLSLQRYDLRFPDDHEFVGLRNYVDVLTSPLWWDAFLTTVIITVVSVVIELVLGMPLALVMHRAIFGRRTVRASILIPYGIVTVVAALAWRFAFDPTTGFVNELLNTDRAWLTERCSSLVVIIAHRGLEDHAVHGPAAAGRARRSCPKSCSGRPRSTEPPPGSASATSSCRMMKPAILVALLFRTLDAFRVFDTRLRARHGAPTTPRRSRSSATTSSINRLNLGHRLRRLGADLPRRADHRRPVRQGLRHLPRPAARRADEPEPHRAPSSGASAPWWSWSTPSSRCVDHRRCR